MMQANPDWTEDTHLKIAVKTLVLVLLIALLAVLVPSPAPTMAEGLPSVLPAYQPVALEGIVEPIDYGKATPFAPNKSAYLPDRAGYRDDTLSVRIETMRAYDTTIQLTWVQIASPTQLRTELCKPYPSRATARADVIAKRVKAVLAINGDYFTHRKEGYIIRNGVTLRERADAQYDALIIDDNGDLTILPKADQKAIESFPGKIIHAFAFGPGLVIDGEQQSDFTLRENAPDKRTQRIALAQMDKLSYLIVATEGPENKNSKGLTMDQFATLLHALHVKQAYNLDGGSSSSVVLDGKKINSLSTHKIRAIGDILYFVTGEGTSK